MVSGQYYGRVKAMFSRRNKREESGRDLPAPASNPRFLNGARRWGEKFKVYEDEASQKIANRRAQILREQGMRTKSILPSTKSDAAWAG